MSINFKQKFEDYFEVILVILLDCILVILVGLSTKFVKWIIELIYNQKLETIDNQALVYVYLISKYLLISIVFLYAALDILEQIKKIFKRLGND